MQVVINISTIAYQAILNANNVSGNWGDDLLGVLCKGVANGTPLLKGTGRLIILSEDAVKREQVSLRFSCQNWISEVGLSNATVAIIEADKEESEE